MAGPDPFIGLDPTFAGNLRAFMAAAPMPLSIASGFRSVDRQAQLFDAAVAKYGSEDAARKWVAPPGHSMHNRGEAVDLGYGGGGLGSGNQALIDWAHQNAGKYGLTFPLSNENWHIEPIGARGDVTSPSAAMVSPGGAAPPITPTIGPRIDAQQGQKTWMDFLMPQEQPSGANDPWSRLFAGQNPFGDNPLRAMMYSTLHSMFT